MPFLISKRHLEVHLSFSGQFPSLQSCKALYKDAYSGFSTKDLFNSVKNCALAISFESPSWRIATIKEKSKPPASKTETIKESKSLSVKLRIFLMI